MGELDRLMRKLKLQAKDDRAQLADSVELHAVQPGQR